MSPRIKPVIAFSIIIFLAIIVAGAFKLLGREANDVVENVPTQKACTEEVVLCPDGKTSVGRTGPNCELAACPEVNNDENIDTSDWQTYRNEEFGFEFKYPEEWSLQEGTAIKDDFDFIHIGSVGPLNINMVDKELNTSNIQGIYGKVDNERIEVIKVGGVDSYMFSEGDAGCRGNIVQIPNNKQIINFGFIDCDKNTEAEDNRVAILSTFKFIN